MAQKRPSTLEQNPPSASSSDVEDSEEGSEPEEEGSEPEEELDPELEVKPTQVSLKNPKSNPNPKSLNSFPIPKPSSGDEAESNSESGSDSDDEPVNHMIAPRNAIESDSESGSDSDSEPANHMIAPRNAVEVKSITDTPKSKKPIATTTITSPSKGSSAAKRPLEDDEKVKRERKKLKKFAELEVNEENDGHNEEAGMKSTEDKKKRPKKLPELEEKEEKNSHNEESGKKSMEDKKPFKRVWSDEDEIIILNGLIDFKKKGNSVTHLIGFADFIKESVQATEFTKAKLNEKIHRLKQKYHNNAKRAKPGGDPVISRPHELKSYQLSKQIWGDIDAEVEADLKNEVELDVKKSKNKVSSNGIAPPKVKVSAQQEEVNGSGSEYFFLNQSLRCPNFLATPILPPCLGAFIADKGWDSFKNLNAEEFNHRWKDVLISETKAYIGRIDLIKDQTELLLDELQSFNC